MLKNRDAITAARELRKIGSMAENMCIANFKEDKPYELQQAVNTLNVVNGLELQNLQEYKIITILGMKIRIKRNA